MSSTINENIHTSTERQQQIEIATPGVETGFTGQSLTGLINDAEKNDKPDIGKEKQFSIEILDISGGTETNQGNTTNSPESDSSSPGIDLYTNPLNEKVCPIYDSSFSNTEPVLTGSKRLTG